MNKAPGYYRYSRNEMLPLLPESYSKVLEIGCGEGNFRQTLNQECEYWGVEPNEFAATIASKKLDKVLHGSYQEIFNQIPNHYFDLVVCCDVIEHMVDHDEFFQSIKQKITKNSCLVVSIPNVRYLGNLFEILIKKDWKYKDEGVLDKTHLRFFTKKSISRTITDNGFVIDQLMGINPVRGSVVERCLYCFATLLFGQDSRFLQFGIRIRCVEALEQL